MGSSSGTRRRAVVRSPGAQAAAVPRRDVPRRDVLRTRGCRRASLPERASLARPYVFCLVQVYRLVIWVCATLRPCCVNGFYGATLLACACRGARMRMPWWAVRWRRTAMRMVGHVYRTDVGYKRREICARGDTGPPRARQSTQVHGGEHARSHRFCPDGPSLHCTTVDPEGG